ncbi:MAG TPA: 2,3-bisphosphoglycerate-independent phosphoglycerate mutase [Candidatus Limnocylindrales bacterium]|nr:2,3-bisphosphoglycerate-independent phosphoglycerate mutase [Candidatus Limnocylindrales bacterium]
MTPPPRARPLVLVVIDGFGLGSRPADDAIAQANMPHWRRLVAEWPHSRLEASAEAVGLPHGQMGNSEVGHLNLGAGRPVLQDLPRIDAAIADGTFDDTPALLRAARRAAETGARLHLIGLVGPGGVHSVDRHAVEIARLAHSLGVRDVVVHALLDGRDTPPRSADGFVPDLERRLSEAHPGARIATIGGRYFAMDRDQRWERTQRGYEAIVHGRGPSSPSAIRAVLDGYARGESDEFIQPTVIDAVDGRVRADDVVIHFNFRADRARQLTHALVDGDEFDRAAFDRGERPRNLHVVTLTDYEAGLPVHVAFGQMTVSSLSAIFANLGWRQLHIAETEKYAHITYFFNGGVEAPFDAEQRKLVPSPKVATYDQQPQMSAAGVTDALVEAIRSDHYEFVVVNYANPDMVGHTGVWDATVRAVEVVDECLGRIVDVMPSHGLLCITADHGNADEMRDAAGNAQTSHSLNPVPVVLIGDAVRGRHMRAGVLADVAPTLLDLLGVPAAEGMTGRSLLDG